MEYSLKLRIGLAEHKVTAAKRALEIETAELRKLENARVHCPHTFEPAVKGYEHEGGYCTLCGINELYAHTLAKWAKTA